MRCTGLTLLLALVMGGCGSSSDGEPDGADDVTLEPDAIEDAITSNTVATKEWVPGTTKSITVRGLKGFGRARPSWKARGVTGSA